MLIENPESLKTWLTSYLEPLCDADPAALSKYVIALIKKEKPLPDLRESMESQMEVFLQKATKTFIEDLFRALETKEYVDGSPRIKTDVDDYEGGASRIVKPDPDAVPVLEIQGEKQPADSTTPVRSPTGGDTVVERSMRGSGGSGGASGSDRYRRTEGGSYDRNRRRSPTRRLRRSPPPGGPVAAGGAGPAGAGGRTRYGGGRRGTSRSRSRSPPPYSRRRRGSPYRGRSRSRSYSPHYKRRTTSRGSTPTKDEETNPYLNASAAASAVPKRPRCRDYDEKGFCLQGDQCKFDHGNDAVVLEDAVGSAVPGVTPYQPTALSSAVYADPYIPSSSGLPLPPLHLPPPGYPTPAMLATRKRGYDDSAGGDMGGFPPNKQGAFSRLGRGGFYRGRGGRGGGGGGHPGNSSTQLAVRNIPPNLNNIAHLNNHFARFGTLVNVQVQFEGDPASALVTFANFSEAELAFHSSEAVLGNRFIKMFYHYERPNKKFGSVKERLGDTQGEGREKVKFEGDMLTKTIVNLQPKTEEEQVAQDQQKAEEKAAAIAAIKKNQELLEVKAQMKKEAEEKRKEQVSKVAGIQKSKQDLLAKLMEEQKNLILRIETKKATMKPDEKSALMTLLKSVSASVDNAREEVKRAMQMTVVKKGPAELQKELLDAELELFQSQQDGTDLTSDLQKRVNQLRIEAARQGLLSTSRPPRGGGGGVRGFRGQRRVGFYSPRYRGGGGRGGGGGAARRGTTLDRRPSKILVSGYETEEKDQIVEHFQKFGEVAETIEDDAVPSVIVQYKTRREAEQAMLGGKAFGDRSLTLSWYTIASGVEDPADLDASHGETAEHEEEVDDDYTPLDPTYLPPGLGDEQEEETDDLTDTSSKEVHELLYNDDEKEEDEEEEEEDEERSWKR